MFRNLQCEIKQTKSNKEGPLMSHVTRLSTDSCTIQNVSKNDIECGYVDCNVYLYADTSLPQNLKISFRKDK